MKRIFIFLLVLSSVALVPLTAAENETTAQPTDGSDAVEDAARAAADEAVATEKPTVVGRVDNVVTLVSYSYNDGQIRLVFDAERPTYLTVSDAFGPFASEGVSDIPQKSRTIPEGRSELVMDVTEWRGSAGVSVSTARNSIAVSAESSEPVIGGPWTKTDVQQSHLTGALAALGVGAVLARRKKRGGEDVIEQQF